MKNEVPKFRLSRQRQVILEELNKVKSHPTALEVYEMVRRRLPRISLGTVYRNLDVLSESGQILKIESAGTQRRYDATTDEHYHLRCLRCGRVEDAPVEPVASINELLSGKCDFAITGHRLEFLGYCAACQQSGKAWRTAAS